MNEHDDDSLQLIEDCEARESRLSDWERTFVSDLRTWLELGRTLTKNQRERLDEVWERVTKKG